MHREVRLGVELLVAAVGLALIAWAWRADRAFYERHMTFLYCFTEESDQHWLVVKRVAAFVFGLATLGWVRPRAGRFVANRWPRIGGLVALRIVLPTLAALVVCDLILRATGPRLDLPPPFTQSDSRYGWILIPSHATTLVYAGRNVTYAVNARSNRARSIDDEPDPSLATLLFGGESITLGHGIDYDQSYPAVVGRHLGVQSVNLGVHGYAEDQIYLRTIDALSDFKHAVAVVTLVLSRTISRITYRLTPRLALAQDGSFETVGPGPRLWWSSPIRNTVVERIWHYDDDEAIDVGRAALRETARAARAHGAFPLFVWTNYDLPCLPDAQGTPAIYRSVFDGLDVAHILVDIPPAERLTGDQHPGVTGHDHIAAAIEAVLREHGVPAAAR
jgi:hypothetical protein